MCVCGCGCGCVLVKGTDECFWKHQPQGCGFVRLGQTYPYANTHTADGGGMEWRKELWINAGISLASFVARHESQQQHYNAKRKLFNCLKGATDLNNSKCETRDTHSINLVLPLLSIHFSPLENKKIPFPKPEMLPQGIRRFVISGQFFMPFWKSFVMLTNKLTFKS